jgi:acetyl-CoA acyltransferase 1
MSASHRLNKILSQIGAPNTTSLESSPTSKSDDDVVICSAVRTAIGKAKRGNFKDTHPADLLAAVLKGSIAKAGVKPEQVEDVIVGNVLAPGGFAVQARQAAFMAGIPDTAAVSTCNRQCSSGLQAIAHVAAAIKNGYYDIGIAAGVEAMSLNSMGPDSVGEMSPNAFQNDQASQCLIPMGVTSENVVSEFGISRKDQDSLAVASNAKALQAQKEGRFKEEIIPVKTILKDKDGKEKEVTVDKDDGPRATTLEDLAKLKPAFKKDGTTTAGNSSQVSDGAAAVVLARRSVAKKLGLKVIGSFRSFAVKGVPPHIMGIGPAAAIPPALEKAGLSMKDIDIFEINEAFASQAVYCVKKLGVPEEKLNPNGGGIALGHPLGCTGARQTATLFAELKRTNKRYGVVSMCIGTGMGAAAVFERE